MNGLHDMHISVSPVNTNNDDFFVTIHLRSRTYGEANRFVVLARDAMDTVNGPQIDAQGRSEGDAVDPTACGDSNGLHMCTKPSGHDNHRDNSGTTWTAVTTEQLEESLRKRIRDFLMENAADLTDDLMSVMAPTIGKWEKRNELCAKWHNEQET